MSRGASPFEVDGLTDGRADGARDAAILSHCPPGKALGMDVAKDWSWRYKRGYEEKFHPVACQHTGSCQVARERRAAAERAEEQAR